MPVANDLTVFELKPGMMVICKNCIHARLDLLHELSKGKDRAVLFAAGMIEGLEKFDYEDLTDKELFDTVKLAIATDIKRLIRKIEKI